MGLCAHKLQKVAFCGGVELRFGDLTIFLMSQLNNVGVVARIFSPLSHVFGLSQTEILLRARKWNGCGVLVVVALVAIGSFPAVRSRPFCC